MVSFLLRLFYMLIPAKVINKSSQNHHKYDDNTKPNIGGF